MSISRRFLLIAIAYGFAGMVLGDIMGKTGDHTQMPTHAHMMMFGWVSMMLFAFAYRAWPKMADSLLAPIHFWMFQIGAVVHIVALYLLYGGMYEVDQLGPFLGMSAWAVIASMLLFGWNAWGNARD